MSSSKGRGRKRKSNFDQVPADDGFRNYMKNKIKLQRKQFGLQLPPPPPQSPSSRSQSSSAASAHNATPPPTILKRSIHSSGSTVGKVEDSPAKSVRFHVDVLDDANSNRSDASTDPKSISDVLNSLKRQHPVTKRRKRRGRKSSMSRRIQSDDQDSDTFAYNTPKKNTENFFERNARAFRAERAGTARALSHRVLTKLFASVIRILSFFSSLFLLTISTQLTANITSMTSARTLGTIHLFSNR